jgi:hypothetical protein
MRQAFFTLWFVLRVVVDLEDSNAVGVTKTNPGWEAVVGVRGFARRRAVFEYTVAT